MFEFSLVKYKKNQFFEPMKVGSNLKLTISFLTQTLGHKNKINDHKPKKLLIVGQSLVIGPLARVYYRGIVGNNRGMCTLML